MTLQITVHKSGASGMLKIADKILSKYSVSTDIGLVPLEIKGQGCIACLSKINNRDYFSVCDVKSLAIANGVVIPRDIQLFMESMHCVDWNEMTAETKDYIMAILVKLFEHPIKHSNV